MTVLGVDVTGTETRALEARYNELRTDLKQAEIDYQSAVTGFETQAEIFDSVLKRTIMIETIVADLRLEVDVADAPPESLWEFLPFGDTIMNTAVVAGAAGGAKKIVWDGGKTLVGALKSLFGKTPPIKAPPATPVTLAAPTPPAPPKSGASSLRLSAGTVDDMSSTGNRLAKVAAKLDDVKIAQNATKMAKVKQTGRLGGKLLAGVGAVASVAALGLLVNADIKTREGLQTIIGQYEAWLAEFGQAIDALNEGSKDLRDALIKLMDDFDIDHEADFDVAVATLQGYLGNVLRKVGAAETMVQNATRILCKNVKLPALPDPSDVDPPAGPYKVSADDIAAYTGVSAAFVLSRQTDIEDDCCAHCTSDDCIGGCPDGDA
ncbi:hypothetical protein KCG44_08665 [Pacificimonas sp. WHA3]|uniref:Uncharacterized protein n=1 Tax=Pacificimonas pallii TaxID=2827236 RepID=A0ABS6SEM2_9SPHN|nr:hypothetical protein [Pacificimonas pallii]MBV7256857.1 hypothetical protein [Pacificimonas pallii]